MSSAERISFLQEKLQEVRKYYLTLKSEVASIDRRRKRLKKKEREGEETPHPPTPRRDVGGEAEGSDRCSVVFQSPTQRFPRHRGLRTPA